MANIIFPLYKEALLGGAANISLTSGTVKAAFVDTAIYTYNAAHQFLSSVTGIIGTPGTLANKTVSSGNLNSDNVTITEVPIGETFGAILVYIDTGNPATSRLVSYHDTGHTGMPATTDGNNLLVNVPGQGWWTL